MPIQVNVIEDDELRGQIRDMIDGQFRSLVRDEVAVQLHLLVKESLAKCFTEAKLLHTVQQSFSADWYLREQTLRAVLQEYLKDHYGSQVEAMLASLDLDSIATEFVTKKLREKSAK